jgi:hypothetical protein
MRHTPDQNPSNRAVRNPGPRPSGTPRVKPATERSRGRSIAPDAQPAGGWKTVGIGLGIVALVGAGIAAAALQSRHRRSWRGRLQTLAGWIS